MRFSSLRFCALALIVPLSVGLAQAQGPRDACKADVEKLCKDVKQGEGRIAQCLKQNEAGVSPACKDAMAQMHQKMHAFRDACEGDAKQYCKDVKRGHGRILRCLQENEAKLSDGCRAAMQAAHGDGGPK